jgi:hypothetical protein
MSGNQPNIFQGALPIRIGMVDADAFNGTYAKNPFNFKNYNITTMGLTVNRESLPLENAINIVVLGKFQSLIEIDSNRNVLCDFNS